jgi:hypothetical protein
VLVKIDTDEMEGGEDVALALRETASGGIPWFIYLDADDAALTTNAEGALERNDATVLATADAEGGNVGCPMTPSERAHFIGTIRDTSRNMTAADIEVIASALHEYARETIGDRADAE